MTIEMPQMKPVPILTKGLPWYKRGWVWLTSFRKWEITEDYNLYIPHLGITILIPKGFIFDGASIPRALWPLLSPTGILFIPGLIHDFGYKYKCYLDIKRNVIFEDSQQGFMDDNFLEMGKEINGMVTPNMTAWTALKGFGWMAWRKHRKANKDVRVDFKTTNGEEI